MKSRNFDTSTITANKGLIAAEIGGEMVILNLESGIYFVLNGVGVHIWQSLQGKKTAKQIRDDLLAEYDVDLDSCERDLSTLLTQMADEKLIEVRDAVPELV